MMVSESFGWLVALVICWISSEKRSKLRRREVVVVIVTKGLMRVQFVE